MLPPSPSALSTQVASHATTGAESHEAKASETRNFINTLVTAQLWEEGVKAGDIGDRIVDAFFDGDYEKALSRSGHKDFSLREVVALIGRDGLCKLGRTALTQNVQIGAQRRLLGRDAVAGLDRGQQLALTLVKGEAFKRDWIEIARKEGLGANQLRKRIRACQKPEPPSKGRSGRRQKPLADLVVRAFRTVLDRPSPKAFDAFWKKVDFTKEDLAEVKAFRKWTAQAIASLKKADRRAQLVTDAQTR